MSLAPATLRRKAAALLRELAENTPHEQEAERIASLISPRKRPPKVLPFQTRKQSKAIKKAAHKEETGAIREAVFKRADGICELCPTYLPRSQPASELHHLEGGSGRRRQMQAVSNCVAACMWCHRSYHASPEAFRAVVIAWAKMYGYPVPSRFRRPAR